jgi:4-hydroxy-4-methyl-2-oxoglutarate aldolase
VIFHRDEGRPVLRAGRPSRFFGLCVAEFPARMSDTTNPATISLEMMRQVLYSAVVCDALDALGYPHQSPRVQLLPVTGHEKLIGRCKTTLWADMAHVDPRPYELELRAVDACRPDDVFVCAASGSMRSGVWGELLSTAARNSGCVGVIVDGAVRDVAKMRAMNFPAFARGTCVYDSQNRQRVVDVDVIIEIDGVAFAPGDLVIADVDGVVVIPRAVEAEAVRRAWDKVHAENVTRDAIKNGMKATAAYEKFGVL